MFDELFAGKALNIEKTLLFGFKKAESYFTYETDILDSQFRLQITISATGTVDTNLIETETGEPYILYKTNAVGSFVGSTRTAIEEVLMEVADSCYDTEIFKFPQTQEIIRYVWEKYGNQLEFLWKTSPNNAVVRRKDTAKWYGAILTIPKNKLGIDSDEIVEIIDLRIQPDKMAELLSNDNYYPGWHMNKKSWYTIILDGSVSTEEVCMRIDESFLLAR